jgi:hypothetical protein
VLAFDERTRQSTTRDSVSVNALMAWMWAEQAGGVSGNDPRTVAVCSGLVAESSGGDDVVVDLQSHRVGADSNGHADPAFDGTIGKPVTIQVTSTPGNARPRST